jgi:hypothetical protein
MMSIAAAARHATGKWRLFAGTAGRTPRGTLSSAVSMRDDAAMKPLASATAAAQLAHSLTCESTRDASSALSAPSSHE